MPLWTLLANDVTGFLDLVLGLTNGVSFRRPANGVFLHNTLAQWPLESSLVHLSCRNIATAFDPADGVYFLHMDPADGVFAEPVLFGIFFDFASGVSRSDQF